MDFDDVPNGNERLRSAIVKLYANGKGMSSSRLITLAEDYHRRRVAEGRSAAVPEFPDQSTVTRYRDEKHRNLGSDYARAFWAYIRDSFPDLLGLERATDASFVNALFWFYGVDWRSHETLSAQIGDSVFLVYHFTEMLADRMPDAVVTGEITIGKPESRLLAATERQAYDGKLGKVASGETNQGYCFPKFNSICLLLKGARRSTPKFYVFHSYGFDADDKVSWMNGRLARISEGAPLFVSNAYAVRVPKEHGTTLNILPRAAMDASVMAELDRD